MEWALVRVLGGRSWKGGVWGYGVGAKGAFLAPEATVHRPWSFNGKHGNNFREITIQRIGGYPGIQRGGESLPASGLECHNNAAFPIHRRT